MTKVKINPGICGLITTVTALSEDQQEVTVQVKSGCASINKMFAELGNTFDAFEVCLAKPGTGEFYEYASKNFPGHASCPALAGIIKCMEVECKLALPKTASIEFE
ncbi:hypothetical protein CS063_09585 [Sporanaerobium hydrogeniformans]|uniref:Uncharacterized protein n=1 Tax=Sporanaerobium hydrogeniformans TaxID=3072179 RepID=A0AC61DBB5_9FIRM|nr:hypothetical protein [Sporanaerobium hydrogeniformans]PHV70545.1 hypothetical protein CS063_09585 [Sporanaerobium hydrogeniformans]